MKQRLEATHFIEIWKDQWTGQLVNSTLAKIADLEYDILDSKTIGLKTIAIWKIKLKNNETTITLS